MRTLLNHFANGSSVIVEIPRILNIFAGTLNDYINGESSS